MSTLHTKLHRGTLSEPKKPAFHSWAISWSSFVTSAMPKIRAKLLDCQDIIINRCRTFLDRGTAFRRSSFFRKCSPWQSLFPLHSSMPFYSPLCCFKPIFLISSPFWGVAYSGCQEAPMSFVFQCPLKYLLWSLWKKEMHRALEWYEGE